MTKGGEPSGIETEAELTSWAEAVKASVTREELARLVKDYQNASRNKILPALDREFAHRRLKALESL